MKGKCVIVCCLLLTAAAIGQLTKPLTLTGRVIDSSARPVEGATVVCYGVIYEQNQRSYKPLGRAQTTSDGRFSFQETKEAFSPDYLIAGKQGLALGWRTIDRAGENIIRLSKPSLFKGTIVDEIGRPVPGARVRICLKNEMMMERREIAPLLPEGWFTTRTDLQGQFLFDNVPTGATADFGVEAPGKALIWTICDFGPRQGEQFVAGRTDIRIVLPPEACIEGKVVDETTSEPVAGVPVLAMPYGRVGWYFCQDPVKTAPNGRFVLKGLAPNKYLLRVISDKAGSAHLSVTVESGQSVSDVKITLSKGIPFEVMVYDSKNEAPIKDADVTVTQEDAVSRYKTLDQKVTTDANGLARFSLPPGEYEVQIMKRDYGTTTVEQNSLKIDPRQTPRYEVSLPRTARILSGKVLDGQGNAISDASAIYLNFGVPFLTDANGLFEFSGLHSARLPSKIPVLARHALSGLAATAELRDPTKSSRFHGQITLEPAYELTGCVADRTGKSVPAAYVKLFRGRYRQLVAEVATDANGLYSIRSVPHPEDDLEYAILACAEGFGLSQISRIPFHDDTAKPVQIDPIVLLPANEIISGVVQDSNDQPVVGAMVQVYGPRLSSKVGQAPCGRTLTDTQGRFRITGVCKEPLRIYAKVQSRQQQPGETWAYGGNENVRVVLGQNLTFSPSLTGEPLPDLKDLRIDLSPAEADDKTVLVCFFDMQQRPSQNCLRQMTTRAQELEAKGVVLVGIQASKVDQDTLNEWVKKNNISFPVGSVRADEEKIRFAWGVRSLPWLILTDRDHIVTAEGFGLSELDKKIQSAEK